MNVADTKSTAAFPGLRPLEHRKEAQAQHLIDATLVCLCDSLRNELQGEHRFRTVEPQGWENFKRGAASVHALTHEIMETHAATHIGLRAKALALYALLDDGSGQLYDDAAAPDLLAWSLVQDILAEQCTTLSTPVTISNVNIRKVLRSTCGKPLSVRPKAHLAISMT